MRRKRPMWRKRQRNYVHGFDKSDKRHAVRTRARGRGRAAA